VHLMLCMCMLPHAMSHLLDGWLAASSCTLCCIAALSSL